MKQNNKVNYSAIYKLFFTCIKHPRLTGKTIDYPTKRGEAVKYYEGDCLWKMYQSQYRYHDKLTWKKIFDVHHPFQLRSKYYLHG